MTSRIEIPAWGWQAALLFIGVSVGILAGINPTLGLLFAIGLTFVALVLVDLVIGLCILLVLTFLDLIPDILLVSDLVKGFPFPVGITKLFGLLLVLSWLAK